MHEYIYAHNPDDRIINKAVSILQSGGLVAFPTETSWCIACKSDSKTGIEKLKRITGEFSPYSIVILCKNISSMEEYFELNTPDYRFIHRITPGPFIFMMNSKLQLTKKLGIKDTNTGVWIPSHPIPRKILELEVFPLLATIASRNLGSQSLWDLEYAEENLFEFGWELEDIRDLDMILDTGEAQPKNLATVISLTSSEPEMIRQGLGKL